MNIMIVCVGKIKESFYREAVSEYEKRLSRYCKLQIMEVSDEKTPDQATENEEDLIRRKEADRIMKLVKEDAYVIALAIQGKKLDSVAFSHLLQKLGVQGKGNIVFIIGGSLGLHDSVLKRADYLLSFSDMTFPHQLMRVILSEQIYRGYRIMNGEPYHK